MTRPEQLNSPLLRMFKELSLVTDYAFEKRSRSQAQKAVNMACSAEAEVIMDIARNGSLAEKVALEHRLQQRDLEKYATSEKEVKSVRQGLKDLKAGMVAYATLVERPEEYRKQASGYTDRNRDTKLDVPKDGMRYMLASQITRLQNRLSLQLSDEEKVLLVARRALLDSMVEEYSAMQTGTLHGDGQPEQASGEN